MVSRSGGRKHNHFLLIILDSCRHDTFVAAEPETITRAGGGAVERRWSYASWTAPSHYNLLTGLMPHTSPPNVYASEYYKQDFTRYRERLGIADVAFKSMVPQLWLPTLLKKAGYETHAMVSLPVLNPTTGINRDFDSFELMEKHNDMAAMLDRMEELCARPSGGIRGDTPQFFLLNVGETHYPYALPDEAPDLWPRIHGVNGVFKTLDESRGEAAADSGTGEPERFFDQEKLDELRRRQVEAVRYLDREVFPRLYEMLPEKTWVVVTSDHGELFGEGGYFGHGPIQHDKVYEVPFLEGPVNRD